MDVITLAMSLAQFAPSIIKLITGSDKAEDVAGKVVDIAKTVTGKSTGPDAVAAIAADPAKVLEFRQAMGAQQADLEKAYISAAVENASDVNRTMQAEVSSDHWPTYSWRPAIGFSVALAVLLSVLTVFLAYGAAVFYQNSQGLDHLPGILAAVAGIIAVVSPILGIASWYRGKMQANPLIPTDNRG